MTSIAVVAANGKVGSLVVEEAVNRGFDVTAITRSQNKTVAPHALVKDLFDLAADDLAGFDAVVCAYGSRNPQPDGFAKADGHLADALSGSATRLLVVGGAGSLYTDSTHSTHMFDTEPMASSPYAALSSAQGNGLDALRERDDVNWVFISPAFDFKADGERTGEYVLAGEEYTTDSNGVSAISYADYAIAVVDEIERGTHNQERISLRW